MLHGPAPAVDRYRQVKQYRIASVPPLISGQKALWIVADEIGESHLAGENEGNRPRAQAEDQERAADQFDEAGRADQRQRLTFGVGSQIPESR